MEDIVYGCDDCGVVRVEVVVDATVTFGSAAELGMCQDGLMSIGSKRCSFGVAESSDRKSVV